jgi:uncharacterized protein (DUF1330 family)
MDEGCAFGITCILARGRIQGAKEVDAIAQLKITDRAAYDRYQAKFMGVMNRFQGRVLATDESPQVIEGEWNRD